MSDWQVASLAALGADRPAAFATGPFGSAVSSKNFVTEGVPMLRGSNLSENVGVRLDDREVVFVSEELANQFSRSAADQGDLVFTCWGTVGQIGLVDGGARFERYIVSNKQMKMTPDTGRVVPLFLYYYLSQPQMVDLVRGQAIGSSVPGFNLGQLKSLQVAVPSLDEQRAIAEVLGVLDDKIAANDRTLEASDDLVRAKFEGLAGGLRPLGQVAENVRYQVSPGSVDPETRYVGLEHIPRRRMWLSESGRCADVTSTKFAFQYGDVLFGKLRPYFHKVVWAPNGGIVSTDVLVVRAKDDGLRGYLLAAAASDGVVRECSAASEGTRMPRTSWKDFAAVEVVWPGAEAAERFGAEIEAIASLASQLADESGSLAITRDELLPLLMSGKVRVRDAEKIVEEVV